MVVHTRAAGRSTAVSPMAAALQFFTGSVTGRSPRGLEGGRVRCDRPDASTQPVAANGRG